MQWDISKWCKFFLLTRDVGGVLVGSAMGELILNPTLITPRSVIQLEFSFN